MTTSRNDYSYFVYGAEDDQAQKIYKNQVNAEVKQVGDNANAGVDLDNEVNGISAFESEIARSVFSAPSFFTAESFEFHGPSEHTVDGI